MKTHLNRSLIKGVPLLSLSCLAACSQQPNQPNIVLILADDMGFSDIGCYGSEIRTPNINRLAERGIRFTQFYNGGRCCPTRAALLTGLYAHQTGLGGMIGKPTAAPGYRGEISNECITIAEALKSSGYGTYMAGKWHVAHSLDGTDKHNWPLQRGFDHYFGTINGGGNYYSPFNLLSDNDFIKAGPNFYYPYEIADHASKFIRNHVREKPGKPFFLYSAFTSPHWPLHAPDSLIQKQKGRYDLGWDKLRDERLKKMKAIGLFGEDQEISSRDPNIPAWEEEAEKEWMIRRMEVYAAQVEALDQSVGRLIKTLDDLKITENTYIFFLSDNGGCAEELGPGWRNFLIRLSGDSIDSQRRPIEFCNTPDVMPGPENTFQSVGLNWANLQNAPFRLYKHYVHEGGISTPLIITGPKFNNDSGQYRRQPGSIIDILPTCLELAGANYPTTYNGHTIIPMEGRSLMPYLDPKSPHIHEFMFWEHENNRAVRKGDWKLVSAGPKGSWELYNLKTDRIEMTNLAAKQPEIVQELSDEWGRWAIRARVLPKPTKNN
jgi:arylsulfatase A-like enzyme